MRWLMHARRGTQALDRYLVTDWDCLMRAISKRKGEDKWGFYRCHISPERKGTLAAGPDEY